MADTPKNRLIVSGIDLFREYRLVLSDGYVLSPPGVKTYVVDIPGGNSSLDLTQSLTGDITYSNRRQEFVFYRLYTTDVEFVKTQISNFLHGREYDYEMTMDPGYVYHGRFSVDSYYYQYYPNAGKVLMVKISIDAKPYKKKKIDPIIVNAVGGTELSLSAGRMRVKPKIQVGTPTKVIYKGKVIDVPIGTWTLNDVVIGDGQSAKLYVNSYPVYNVTWGELRTGNPIDDISGNDNGYTWGELNKYKVYQLHTLNGPNRKQIKMKYREAFVTNDNILMDDKGNLYATERRATYQDYQGAQWMDLVEYTTAGNDVPSVYIDYEWGDL